MSPQKAASAIHTTGDLVAATTVIPKRDVIYRPKVRRPAVASLGSVLRNFRQSNGIADRRSIRSASRVTTASTIITSTGRPSTHIGAHRHKATKHRRGVRDGILSGMEGTCQIRSTVQLPALVVKTRDVVDSAIDGDPTIILSTGGLAEIVAGVSSRRFGRSGSVPSRTTACAIGNWKCSRFE